MSIASTGKTSSLIVVAAAFWWCVSLWLFLHHGQTDFIISVSTFMASVAGLLAWRGRLQPGIVIWMVAGWGVCWCLLPEYSYSPGDRLALIWSANRISFGGTTVMAIAAVLAGVVSTAFADFRNRWTECMVDDGATGRTLVNPNWTTAALRGCKWLFFGTLIILICVVIIFTGKVATLGQRASINARANELVTKSNAGSREAFEELRKLAESHSRFDCLTAIASMRKIKGFNSERMQVALQVLSQDDSVGWHEGLLLLSEMPELSAECAPALLRALRKHTFGAFHDTALQSLARIDGAVCEFKLELLDIASQRKDAELTDMISNTIAGAKCP